MQPILFVISFSERIESYHFSLVYNFTRPLCTVQDTNSSRVFTLSGSLPFTLDSTTKVFPGSDLVLSGSLHLEMMILGLKGLKFVKFWLQVLNS